MAGKGGKLARGALLAGLLGLFLLLLHQFGLFVMVLWLNFNDPQSTAFIDAARRQQQRAVQPAGIAWQWVGYDDISPQLKRAVVSAEDSGFMAHGGVEWQAMRDAWAYNRRQAKEGATRRRGGSTITQQLAKNLFLSPSRSYLRKLQELVLALMIEAVMSKRRILELYLNVAQWGETTFGAESAARQYYQRPAARLTGPQAARLAAMLPNPRLYEARGHTAYLQAHAATLLKRMPQVQIP